MPKSITPNLWFDTQAEEAAEYYCSIFPDSRIHRVTHYTGAGPMPAGTVLTVDFELQGQRFTALNGGPEFKFDEAVSFLIECEDQAEIDRYWAQLSSVPEAEQCGWCKDRFGVSWQITPQVLGEVMTSGDQAKIDRVTQVFLSMHKLDVAAIEAAARGG